MTIRVDFSSLAPKPWLDGNQIHALFNQDKIWIDRYLETHVIEEISDRYLGHLIPFIVRNYWRYQIRAQIVVDSVLEEHWFGITEWIPGLPDPLPSKVESTPLFQALTGELEKREEEMVDPDRYNTVLTRHDDR